MFLLCHHCPISGHQTCWIQNLSFHQKEQKKLYHEYKKLFYIVLEQHLDNKQALATTVSSWQAQTGIHPTILSSNGLYTHSNARAQPHTHKKNMWKQLLLSCNAVDCVSGYKLYFKLVLQSTWKIKPWPGPHSRASVASDVTSLGTEEDFCPQASGCCRLFFFSLEFFCIKY